MKKEIRTFLILLSVFCFFTGCSNEKKIERLENKARESYESGDALNAISLYNEAETIGTLSNDAKGTLALIYSEEAVKKYNEGNSDSFLSNLAIAENYGAVSPEAKAIAVEVYLSKGYDLLDEGDKKGALDEYLAVLKYDDSNLEANMGVAVCAYYVLPKEEQWMFYNNFITGYQGYSKDSRFFKNKLDDYYNLHPHFAHAYLIHYMEERNKEKLIELGETELQFVKTNNKEFDIDIPVYVDDFADEMDWYTEMRDVQESMIYNGWEQKYYWELFLFEIQNSEIVILDENNKIAKSYAEQLETGDHIIIPDLKSKIEPTRNVVWNWEQVIFPTFESWTILEKNEDDMVLMLDYPVQLSNCLIQVDEDYTKEKQYVNPYSDVNILSDVGLDYIRHVRYPQNQMKAMTYEEYGKYKDVISWSISPDTYPYVADYLFLPDENTTTQAYDLKQYQKKRVYNPKMPWLYYYETKTKAYVETVGGKMINLSTGEILDNDRELHAIFRDEESDSLYVEVRGVANIIIDVDK